MFGLDDNQDYTRPIIHEKHKELIKDWALSSAAVVMEERKPLCTPGFHNSEVYVSLVLNVVRTNYVSVSHNYIKLLIRPLVRCF